MSVRYIGAHSLQLWLTFRRGEIKHDQLLGLFSETGHLRSMCLFRVRRIGKKEIFSDFERRQTNHGCDKDYT
jgi:hypothetical protein